MKGSGYGVLPDIGLGIAGALLGGFLSGAMFGIPFTGFNLTSLIVALIGAIIAVGVGRGLSRGTRTRV